MNNVAGNDDLIDVEQCQVSKYRFERWQIAVYVSQDREACHRWLPELREVGD